MHKTHNSLLSQFRLFEPRGVISTAEFRFTIIDMVIIFCIIAPTTIFIIVALWRYRVGRNAKFDPDFTRSGKIEILTWGVPFAAVVALGYVSWQGVFRINPYAPTELKHPALVGGIPPKNGKFHPLVINVVATDWQWLFIYPKQGIASLNSVTVPTGRNIEFRLTSTDVVNDFFIPQLVGMIDVMPGMRTKDTMRINRPGTWRGFSANISGAGFSWMVFPTHAVPPAAFAAWTAKMKTQPHHLTYRRFTAIAQPTINLHHKPAYFSAVAPHLFMRVVQAAEDGTTYPTRMSLTKKMVKDGKLHDRYLIGYGQTKS